jgi:hypothetical protein
VQERLRFGEELGERDGAGGGEAGRTQEEALECGVEGECRAEGLDLRDGVSKEEGREEEKKEDRAREGRKKIGTGMQR